MNIRKKKHSLNLQDLIKQSQIQLTQQSQEQVNQDQNNKENKQICFNTNHTSTAITNRFHKTHSNINKTKNYNNDTKRNTHLNLSINQNQQKTTNRFQFKKSNQQYHLNNTISERQLNLPSYHEQKFNDHKRSYSNSSYQICQSPYNLLQQSDIINNNQNNQNVQKVQQKMPKYIKKNPTSKKKQHLESVDQLFKLQARQQYPQTLILDNSPLQTNNKNIKQSKQLPQIRQSKSKYILLSEKDPKNHLNQMYKYIQSEKIFIDPQKWDNFLNQAKNDPLFHKALNAFVYKFFIDHYV